MIIIIINKHKSMEATLTESAGDTGSEETVCMLNN